VCGEVHEGPPPGFGWRVPDLLGDVPDEELEKEHWLVVDELVRGFDDGGSPFFGIHGNLEIPVAGWDDPFGWTLWASLSGQQATWALETWFDDERTEAAPAGGYLLNTIPVYPEQTHGLLVSVHWRPVGVRPLIYVEEEGHPLGVEQRDGITPQRVDEIAHKLRDLGWAD
jgi:hypothetical protein